jgi:molecular chaperone DnaK (HSP70)
MMNSIRLFLCAILITMAIAPSGVAQITSWTDKNGVRHFSNVETSGEKKAVKKMKEYKTNASDEEVEHNRDRFQILQMYEEDREKEEKKKALEQKMKEAEEKEKKKQEAADKAARERRKACMEHKKELNDLQHTGWEDYDAADVSPAYCPDKRWRGAHGRWFDNMDECTERRNQSLKNAYQKAMRQQEEQVKKNCDQ